VVESDGRDQSDALCRPSRAEGGEKTGTSSMTYSGKIGETPGERRKVGFSRHIRTVGSGDTESTTANKVGTHTIGKRGKRAGAKFVGKSGPVGIASVRRDLVAKRNCGDTSRREERQKNQGRLELALGEYDRPRPLNTDLDVQITDSEREWVLSLLLRRMHWSMT
jgi:hypothetical protein